MKGLLKCIFIIVVPIIIYGCIKSDIYVCPLNNSGNSTEGTNNSGNTNSDSISANSSLINFTASVESLNFTKSMTPIGQGVLTNVYAYDSASVSLIASGNYQSNTIGTLTGLDGYKMYLPNGDYDFYAVSTNQDLTPPTFSNSVSSPLSNGVDYLWWSAQNQNIYSAAFNLNIVFSHKACQIVFDISEGAEMVIDSIVSIHTTAPTEGATMNLKTGVITPATSQQTGFVNQMGINGLKAQSILLPVNNWNYIGVIMNVFVNGESTARYFGGQIAVPNSTLAAGNSYLFSLILNANDVTTSSVNVSSWTIVKDNKPFYPAEL